MTEANIFDLVEMVTAAFHMAGYTERSAHEKKKIMLQIARLHESHGCPDFSDVIVSEFIEDTVRRYHCGDISYCRYSDLTKTAEYLTEFHQTGSLRYSKRDKTPRLANYYEKILAEIIENDKWSISRRKRICQFTKLFFRWLESEGIYDLKQIDEHIIRDYLVFCSSHIALNSLDTTKGVLRVACSYFSEIGIGAIIPDNAFTFCITTGKKVLPHIPQAEIAATLNAINRDSNNGKRDYAMIILAVVTGLRSSDIINLKLGDIDWVNGEIKIFQVKTGKALALPLTEDVGLAIREYILSTRPKSDLPYVFLRTNAPHEKLGCKVPYNQHRRYRKKAGLKSFAFHGLRRSVASRMVISGTDVKTVSQTLGQYNIDSSKQYISFDSDGLKECALSFSGIEPLATDAPNAGGYGR
jgi:integrase